VKLTPEQQWEAMLCLGDLLAFAKLARKILVNENGGSEMPTVNAIIERTEQLLKGVRHEG